MQMNRLSFGRGPLFASLCCATAAQHLYEQGHAAGAARRARVILCASTITLFPAFASYFLSKRQEYFCFYTATKRNDATSSRHAAARARAAGGGAVYKQRLVNANTDRFPKKIVWAPRRHGRYEAHLVLAMCGWTAPLPVT
ncbi:hypothetical protein EVAR_88463_1 [Eumeta japonica]|uniref:Uncharacterized protein n=1 Tax=Eumeta variegata TaxID=151549 RepID=A0A4C1XTH6_EUMVA|nr:hypothetical protein EVAR_88463_1 [Eumeta japonica]